MSSLYSTLALPTSATTRDIRSAYMRMSPLLHPDRHPASSRAAATAAFRRLHRAYEVLSEPSTRWVYDEYGDRGLDVLDELSHLSPLLTEEAFRREFASVMRQVGYARADREHGHELPAALSVEPSVRAVFLAAGRPPRNDPLRAVSLSFGARGSLQGVPLLPAPRPAAALHASVKHSWIRRASGFGRFFKEPQSASLGVDLVQPVSHLTVARAGAELAADAETGASRVSLHAAVTRRVAASTSVTFKVRFVPSVLVRAHGLAAALRPSLRVGHDADERTRARAGLWLGPRGAAVQAGATRRLSRQTVAEASLTAVPAAGAAELQLAAKHRFTSCGNPLVAAELEAQPALTVATDGSVQASAVLRQPRLASRPVSCFAKATVAGHAQLAAGVAVRLGAPGAFGPSGWERWAQVSLTTGSGGGASAVVLSVGAAGLTLEVPVYFMPSGVPLWLRAGAALALLPLAAAAGRVAARRGRARFARERCSEAGRSMLERREAALRAQEGMRRRARASRAEQQRGGGLVVLEASYSSPALLAGGVASGGGRFFPVVDAAVPLQCLVRGRGPAASLELPAGVSKADCVPGLCFPAPEGGDSAVELAVLYAFGGRRYRAVVADLAALRLPGAGEELPWGGGGGGGEGDEAPPEVSVFEPETVGVAQSAFVEEEEDRLGGEAGGGAEDGADKRATAATDLEHEVMDDDGDELAGFDDDDYDDYDDDYEP